MKKLIFCTLILSCEAMALQEIATREDSNQIVTKLRDIELTRLMSETSEFNDCREMYPYPANGQKPATSAANAQLDKAVQCFRKKLGGNKNKTQIEELSQKLNLQSYGLVKSNEINSIQKYLTDKMYESLTGIDPSEENPQKIKENLKFGKKKMVDQKVFLQLYKTQLGKNALFEISRFCFENLRPANGDKSKTNFLEHWKGHKLDTIADVDDSGDPAFTSSQGKFSNPEDKKKLYEEIVSSIGRGDASTQDFLKSFFEKCGALISPLCEEFKAGVKSNVSDNETAVDTQRTKGSSACLAKTRIQEYKAALINADKVIKYFDENMSSGSNDTALMISALDGKPVKFYGDGTDAREASIDELTNNTATSILSAEYKSNSDADKKSEECENSPELASCEAYIYKDDEIDKIKHKVELELTLKREVEMERVKKLKEANDQSLEEYLEKNGFFEILQDKSFATMNADTIARLVGENFEAKKQATLAEITTKMGRRQAKTDTDVQNNSQEISKAIQDTKEERARLAQVVLFNNIITSHLELSKKDSSGNKQVVGRNTGAWRKEQDSLDSLQVNADLFENLKAKDDPSGGISKGDEIAGFEVLDQILGKTTNP